MPQPTTRLGVLGWPVAHSRSPAMHNAALADLGLPDWRYQLLPVPPELFAETVAALHQSGFAGVNVTIPHKQAALALATDPTARAQAIGAANTLVFGPGERIRADNTDAPALIDALPVDPRGRRALVLGAGGSARAAIWALRDAGADPVYVWNRTPARARALAQELGATAIATPTATASATATAPAPVTARPNAHQAAQILVNCTSVGLDAGDDPFKQLPITAEELERYECVVDLVYREPETRLVEAARERAVAVIDGLELLVGQGALSFEQFTGRRAPIDTMREAVRGG